MEQRDTNRDALLLVCVVLGRSLLSLLGTLVVAAVSIVFTSDDFFVFVIVGGAAPTQSSVGGRIAR